MPADTGGGDQVLVDPSTLYYSFEVNEGFYADAGAAANFDPLTSLEGGDPYYLTQLTHSDLIVGHVYTYRVMAANLMGWGAFSPEFQFVPRRVPLAPMRAPWDVTAQKTRETIFIEFDPVLDNQGDEISAYTVYIDGGLDSDTFTGYATDTTLSWNSGTSPAGGVLALTTGRTYRLKYSATNAQGEGLLSPEVQILLAETPSAPVALRRISIWELPAGSISVKWDLPSDNGGHPITGYTVYLDGLL